MSENQNLDLFDEVVDEQQSVEATPAAEESFAESLSTSAESVEEEVAVVEEALASESEESEELDPVQEFKEALMMKSGDWFVIHSYAGYEKRVKENLESRIKSLDMDAFI